MGGSNLAEVKTEGVIFWARRQVAVDEGGDGDEEQMRQVDVGEWSLSEGDK